MLRKHFMMSGLEKPDYIITYYADQKIPFIGGEETKNLTMWETGSESEPLAEFKVVSDTYTDGYGEWVIKTSNPTAYYGLIEDKYGNSYQADGDNTNVNITGILFPEGITEIGGKLLNQASGLTDVTLPQSLTYLGDYVFDGCSILNSITIPESVTTLGNQIFKECVQLDKLYMEGLPPTPIHGSDVFESANPKIYTYFPQLYADHDFWRAYTDNITEYPNTIYYSGDNLSSIFKTAAVRKYYAGFGAARYDSPLQKVPIIFGNSTVPYIKLPDSIEEIPGSTFKNTRITTVILPANLKICRSRAFPYNIGGKLPRNIYYNNTIEQWCLMDFEDVTGHPFYGSSDASKFYINDELISELTIPEGVTKLKPYTFSYFPITKVVVPKSVQEVDYTAFQYCTTLTEVIWDTSSTCEITNLPTSPLCLFDSSSNTIISVTIGDLVSNVPRYLFTKLSNLNIVNIGKSVKNIEPYAFQNAQPTTINYNGSLEDWCSIFFENNYSTCLRNPDCILYINNNPQTDIILPNTLTSIGQYAFYNYKKLTSITIPKTLLDVGYYAFSSCSGLSKTNYEGTIDQWCSISFNNASSNPVINSHNLYINDTLVEHITINNTDSIKNHVLQGCTSLQTLTMSDVVTTIGKESFANCINLNNVTFSPNITNIGDNAFYNTPLLSGEVSLESIQTIGVYAFNGSGITKCTFGNNISIISGYAFLNCASLSEVYMGDNVTTVDNYAFANCSNLSTIRISPAIQTLGLSCFKSCTNLNNVDLQNVSSLGNECFRECSALTSISIPSSLTVIPTRCFQSSGLSEVILSEGLIEIQDYAFYETNLTSIQLPQSLRTIGKSAFAKTDITSITIPDGVPKLPESVFSQCTKLQTITIPKSVTSFGGDVFSSCKALTNIIFTGTKSEFLSISRSQYWDYSLPSTCVIHCTDGDLSIANA